MQLSRFLVLWAFAIFLQWCSGAYQSESGADPDEPAHIVSGLMAADYIRTGWGHAPVEFARSYYLHYPKVAVGHWPPVFYAEQAAWTLVFPSSRQSLLVMMALQIALLGTLLWPLLRDRFGQTAAWCGVAVLSTLPNVLSSASMIMTELPLALLILLALRSWGQFLETGYVVAAVVFGCWAAAAMLTKGTGVVLAGVPLLSVWLTGRWDLLRRFAFWVPALMVLGACLPWYLFAPDALHQRVVTAGGIGFATKHLQFPPVAWAAEFGGIVALLTLVGIVTIFVRRARGEISDGILASAAALVIAASAFPFFLAAWEARHLVEAAPAFVLVAAAGVSWIGSRALFKPALLAVTIIVTIGWNLAALPRQYDQGYRDLTDSFGAARTILISSGAMGEGIVVSEIAQREPHPVRYIVRASKLFADIEWQGRVKRLRVESTDQVHAMLVSLPIDLVVLDTTTEPYGYQQYLKPALTEHPELWRAIQRPARFEVFQRISHGPAISSAEVEAQLKAVLKDPIP